MKQVNFSHPGGFPLEQETLDRLQTAYRHELFEALKSHLGINPDNDYIITPPKNGKEGWAIIHPKNEQGIRTKEGILYPIQTGAQTNFLKTIRTGTNLTYGTGVIQTAYFDYQAQYISDTDYANRPVSPPITDALTVHYYNLNDPAFIVIKDIQTIEANINSIKTDINVVKQSYLPLNGSKAMEGDLDLGSYKLSKLDIKDSAVANVRVTDFRLGSNLGRAIVNDSTSLSLNYGSDWGNTNIGGKVYLNNISSSNSTGSLLVVDSSNQVTKSNTLIESLIKRITDLEEKPATAVPKGMIAIWGKPAPFPEGWEEYVPLRGRMPVGFDSLQYEFNTVAKEGGSKSTNISVAVPVSGYTSSENTSLGTKGKLAVSTGKEEKGENLESLEKALDSPNINFSVNNLNPYRVVHFIEYTGNIIEPADTIAPTTPGNLIASNITSSSLTLSWTAPTDNIGVTNYLVYKDNNNTPLAELGKNVLTYNVTGLSANTLYSFQVRAKDAAGNLSGPATLSVTTLNTTPVTPTLPTLQYGYSSGENMVLQWPNFIDEEPVTYELYRSINGGGPMLLQTSTDTFYYDILSNGVTYSYQIRINSNGYTSGYSNTVTVTARP